MTTIFPGAESADGLAAGTAMALSGMGGAVRTAGTATAERAAQANVPMGAEEATGTVGATSSNRRRRRQRDTVLSGSTGPGEGGSVKTAGITGV